MRRIQTTRARSPSPGSSPPLWKPPPRPAVSPLKSILKNKQAVIHILPTKPDPKKRSASTNPARPLKSILKTKRTSTSRTSTSKSVQLSIEPAAGPTKYVAKKHEQSKAVSPKARSATVKPKQLKKPRVTKPRVRKPRTAWSEAVDTRPKVKDIDMMKYLKERCKTMPPPVTMTPMPGRSRGRIMIMRGRNMGNEIHQRIDMDTGKRLPVSKQLRRIQEQDDAAAAAAAAADSGEEAQPPDVPNDDNEEQDGDRSDIGSVNFENFDIFTGRNDQPRDENRQSSPLKRGRSNTGATEAGASPRKKPRSASKTSSKGKGKARDRPPESDSDSSDSDSEALATVGSSRRVSRDVSPVSLEKKMQERLLTPAELAELGNRPIIRVRGKQRLPGLESKSKTKSSTKTKSKTKSKSKDNGKKTEKDKTRKKTKKTTIPKPPKESKKSRPGPREPDPWTICPPEDAHAVMPPLIAEQYELAGMPYPTPIPGGKFPVSSFENRFKPRNQRKQSLDGEIAADFRTALLRRGYDESQFWTPREQAAAVSEHLRTQGEVDLLATKAAPDEQRRHWVELFDPEKPKAKPPSPLQRKEQCLKVIVMRMLNEGEYKRAGRAFALLHECIAAQVKWKPKKVRRELRRWLFTNDVWRMGVEISLGLDRLPPWRPDPNYVPPDMNNFQWRRRRENGKWVRYKLWYDDGEGERLHDEYMRQQGLKEKAHLEKMYKMPRVGAKALARADQYLSEHLGWLDGISNIRRPTKAGQYYLMLYMSWVEYVEEMRRTEQIDAHARYGGNEAGGKAKRTGQDSDDVDSTDSDEEEGDEDDKSGPSQHQGQEKTGAQNQAKTQAEAQLKQDHDISSWRDFDPQNRRLVRALHVVMKRARSRYQALADDMGKTMRELPSYDIPGLCGIRALVECQLASLCVPLPMRLRFSFPELKIPDPTKVKLKPGEFLLEAEQSEESSDDEDGGEVTAKAWNRNVYDSEGGSDGTSSEDLDHDEAAPGSDESEDEEEDYYDEDGLWEGTLVRPPPQIRHPDAPLRESSGSPDADSSNHGPVRRRSGHNLAPLDFPDADEFSSDTVSESETDTSSSTSATDDTNDEARKELDRKALLTVPEESREAVEHAIQRAREARIEHLDRAKHFTSLNWLWSHIEEPDYTYWHRGVRESIVDISSSDDSEDDSELEIGVQSKRTTTTELQGSKGPSRGQ